ncbi:MAG: hypothetical protein JXA49_01410 [Actinobacteria bacterium]|nr:hypothetical protein [Actinomycetota bacterium]
MNGVVHLGKSEADYKKLGIEREPAVREDGIRSNGGKGSFEWWYFDAEYSDGTKIVTVFFTKSGFDIRGPSCPTVSITVDLPGGAKIEKLFSEPKGTMINASREKCVVVIGPNTARYDDGDYIIHFEDGDIEYNCTMKSRAPMWRPGAGYYRFNAGDKESEFAWFVAQPAADLIGTLKVGDQIIELEGTGYHDHNWGDTAMPKLLNHWYWCRGSVGPYTVICCDIVSEKKYGYKRLPLIMLAKDGEVVSDNEEKLVVERSGTVYHPFTKKFIDNKLTFRHQADDGANYTLEFERDHDIVAKRFLDDKKIPAFKRMLGKAMCFNPTYVRCIGVVRMTVEKDGNREEYEEEALWEQMFFGRNRDAIINSPDTAPGIEYS